MATINVPHYFDVASVLETSILDMSRESGTGINLMPYRYISSIRKRMEFSFSLLGDKSWRLSVIVEKVGGESKGSAYRLQLIKSNDSIRDEIVHLTNNEQLADLGLNYAELITSTVNG